MSGGARPTWLKKHRPPLVTAGALISAAGRKIRALFHRRHENKMWVFAVRGGSVRFFLGHLATSTGAWWMPSWDKCGLGSRPAAHAGRPGSPQRDLTHSAVVGRGPTYLALPIMGCSAWKQRFAMRFNTGCG